MIRYLRRPLSRPIKASNTGRLDWFGIAIGLDRDTLAVGAMREDSSARGVDGNQSDDGTVDSGAVYVFRREDGVWSQQAYLKASNSEPHERFGRSVAVSGDTVAVGSRSEDGDATGINGDQSSNDVFASGAVYVFARNGRSWSQEAYIKSSNTHRNMLFADALAIWGNTLVVGASGESSGATGVGGDETDRDAPSSGAVYVFVRTAGIWNRTSRLRTPAAHTVSALQSQSRTTRSWSGPRTR